ncbi:MAG: hypothetical protein MUF64_19035 [Polyangiaceae bacterium]|nr:hypothetical protein [Polyangiaceae bacterium]
MSKFRGSRRWLLLPLGLLGCHRWDHAPGYGERSSFEKQRFSIVPLQACREGLCNLRDPEQHEVEFKIDHIEVSSPGGRGPLRFQIEYRGVTASCAHPAVPGPGGALSPFVCNLTSEDRRQFFQLELDESCQKGALRQLKDKATVEGGARQVSTDRVTILGHNIYAREVSLSDPQGTLIFADAPGGDWLLWKRPRAEIRPVDTVAVLATLAFIEAEGTPEMCLRKETNGY